ncbi:hypothetical protein HMPREF0645_1334 [Hallella bergensis DSM 17361]|uniref:Uncharacterized protein n=1 Tax=Hallella bergensis DSM 17361 TaxID=585502 RepID=D1PWJ9_9BACT|nr:hypothetical protein HMPREF0645_1334 [Hallella bergensis DSM 17361]KXB42174.1 hypothetical protein HMPREF1870_01477 [Bacteroidales bacterium KA00344]
MESCLCIDKKRYAITPHIRVTGNAGVSKRTLVYHYPYMGIKSTKQ